MGVQTQEAQEPRLKQWEITGYGLGGFASTLPNQFKTQFGMSFMSDVAGVPVGVAGVISMLMSVWDAVNDPIIDHLADRTNTRRWGRYRPHMLLGALCMAVTVVLMFVVPPLSVGGRTVYYGVVLALFSVFFTQFTVPWQALNVHQRPPAQPAAGLPPAGGRCSHLHGGAAHCPPGHPLF